MARIAVCGYMVRHPLAGNMLAYLHYIAGLQRLGHDLLYVEESGWPTSCYNPETNTVGDDPAFGFRSLHQLMSHFGVSFPVCFINRDTGDAHGLEWNEVKRSLSEADLLLNLGGVCWLPEFCLCRRRALVDMDPFFTQVGHMGLKDLEEHHAYFTYGTNIGLPSCSVPTNGITWMATVPPIVPEMWPCEEQTDQDARFTTVANWTAYGSVVYNGKTYGQKSSEFLRLLDLPSLADRNLEIAVSGASAETRRQLAEAGWFLREAAEVSRDPNVYQAYIRKSRGELSACKQAYAETRCGWFSDRSVCYLASARPVIVQECGIDAWLEPGCGVLTFSSVEDAAACIAKVESSYPQQREAARRIAEDIFSYRAVLPKMLKQAGLDG